jgi:hypothetical protein
METISDKIVAELTPAVLALVAAYPSARIKAGIPNNFIDPVMGSPSCSLHPRVDVTRNAKWEFVVQHRLMGDPAIYMKYLPELLGEDLSFEGALMRYVLPDYPSEDIARLRGDMDRKLDDALDKIAGELSKAYCALTRLASEEFTVRHIAECWPPKVKRLKN